MALTLGSWVYGLVEWPYMLFVVGTPNGWEPRFWGLFDTTLGETLNLCWFYGSSSTPMGKLRSKGKSEGAHAGRSKDYPGT